MSDEIVESVENEMSAPDGSSSPEEMPEGTKDISAEDSPKHGTDEQGDPGCADASDDASASDPRTHRFECRSCGYVYDPAEGVRKYKIEAGTAFSELDAIRFRCPVCRSKVGAFRDIGPATKASGFEENLDFGLGVNRLTPGQKNVLIFGSFALAFAFFLSLYSLR